jgi:hypothetical protein
MWIPDPVYRVLPVAYAAAGLFTIWKVTHPMGVVSGGLLVGAGAIIWWLRREAAAKAVASRRHGERRPQPARR